MSHRNEFDQPVGEPLLNWHPRQRPSKTPLQGHYCSLVPLDLEQYSKALFDVLHDNPGESWTYLPYGPFANPIEFHSWLVNNALGDDPFFYVILDPQAKQPLGLCSYLRIDPLNSSIEVGHLNFSTQLKQSTAATEAMYLMMAYAFDELGYRRYEWKCNALNEPSKRAAIRLGFQFEGIFRQSHVVKNRNRDTAWFSIIDKEWPALKIKFQRWLDPNNFDRQGKQVIRLEEIA